MFLIFWTPNFIPSFGEIVWAVLEKTRQKIKNPLGTFFYSIFVPYIMKKIRKIVGAVSEINRDARTDGRTHERTDGGDFIAPFRFSTGDQKTCKTWGFIHMDSTSVETSLIGPRWKTEGIYKITSVRPFVRSSVRLCGSVDLGNRAYDFPDFFHDVGDK